MLYDDAAILGGIHDNALRAEVAKRMDNACHIDSYRRAQDDANRVKSELAIVRKQLEDANIKIKKLESTPVAKLHENKYKLALVDLINVMETKLSTTKDDLIDDIDSVTAKIGNISSSNENITCSICSDTIYKAPNGCVHTTCKHTFHVECMLKHITHSDTDVKCPNCRTFLHCKNNFKIHDTIKELYRKIDNVRSSLLR